MPDAKMLETKRKRSVVADLIVLLVVVAVVAVITHAAVDGLHPTPRARTRNLVFAVNTGIERFREDFGHLPYDALEGGVETNDPRWIRHWLLGMGDDGEPDETVRSNRLWNGPYIEIKEKDIAPDHGWVLVDSWGNPICFEVKAPIFNVGRWDVWSLGRDGKGTKNMAEIGGANEEERRANYADYEEDGNRVNRDNIGNWE